MPFDLSFPTPDNEVSQLQLQSGQTLFVLGANGTGKSSLMQRFAQQNTGRFRKVAAHRQTWMYSNASDLTPANKLQIENRIRHEDQSGESRYRDQHASQRASMTIYEIVDAENVRARSIAAAVDLGDIEAAKEESRVESIISVINGLLIQSNIPVEILIHENENLMASKSGGPHYSAAQLSDGERNALLLAGNVLTAPPDTLLIIDEPERHLHRAIIAPLLSQLFDRRSDCGFVISTHDLDLPLEVPDARTLLLRSCRFNGQSVQGWEADELPANHPIDDTLKRDLLGARRRILFVEGTESSLDKLLYSLLFPMVSVIPKGSCRDVEYAVVGSRAGEGFHWLRAFGIADGDGFDADQIETKRQRGVYALPFYSVEAVYFHPEIIKRVSGRQADITGDDASELLQRALAAGVAGVAGHTERLSRKATKKAVRKLVLDQLPSDDVLMQGQNLSIINESLAILAARKTQIDAAVRTTDWETILTNVPVRESAALGNISEALGFRKIDDYEKAVRRLLGQDNDVLTFVRALFGGLFEELNS